MKNLKKVLALVVALTMVLGTVSFAFTDVDSENEVFTAVQTLSSLNILNGYEDGTFGPEKDITRAEFAAVVCRALGVNAAAQTATQFTDVPADHWASGYISYAAGLGIVNGYGDGKFGPEDNVTYEQAVKMLVVALGFEPMAAQKGGWATGYLVVANQYGMTKGVSNNGNADRGTVAQLVFNALDMPMMIQTGWGTNTEYEVQDGEGDRGYKTLLTELDVEKLDGVVTKTPTIGGQTTDETIEFDITNIDASESYFIVWNGTSYVYRNGGVANLYVAEGINVDEYFAMASTVYAKEIKTGKYEIIAIMPGETSEEVTFYAEDIESGSIQRTEMKYYESDAATKATRLNITGLDLAADSSGTAVSSVYYNNVKVTGIKTASDLATWIGGKNADTVITLYDNDETTAGFDMLVAKYYTHDVIDEVEADRDRFSSKDGNNFKFDFDDDTTLVRLFDKDGNEIEFADFAADDVIAYITDGSTSNYNWIEIINLGQNKVTGTVTQYNSNDNKAWIDDVEYEYSPSLTGSNAPLTSDEGDFYLTMNGTIFKKDTTSSISDNYAYILNADYNTSAGFSKVWQLQLLTKDGSITVFDTKDTFKIYNGVNDMNPVSYDEAVTSAGNPAELAQVVNGGGVTHKSNPEDRLITYKLDGNNKIKEVRFITGASYVKDNTSTAVAYKENSQKLGEFLADDVVIFNVTDSSVDNAKVLGIDSLVDDTDYKGLVARVDATDSDYTCVVITEGAAAIDYTQNVAVVEATGSSKYGDEEVTTITYYTAGSDEAKTLMIDSDTNVRGLDVSHPAIVKGDVVMFAANAEGVATDVDVVAEYTVDSAGGGYYVLDATVTSDAVANEEENAFVVGYINTWTSGSKGRVIAYAGATGLDENGTIATTGDIVITNDAAQYTFVNNRSGSRGYIAPDDWQADADVDVAGNGTATYFFARLLDGVLTDIVVIGDRK